MNRNHQSSRFFEYLVANPTIYDVLFSSSSPLAILRFSQTCRSASRTVDSYFCRAFDINKHLLRFFSDPIGFRSLQARTGAVISGSTALQFFDRTVYPGSDLDLYVDQRYAWEVGHWLQENDYVFQPGERQRSCFDTSLADAINSYDDSWDRSRGLYAGLGISGVFTFFQKSVDDLVEKKVEVMTASINPVASVLRFHSTCVMNLISYEKAYALYPRATFEERRSLGFLSCDDTDEERKSKARAKYSDRGWTSILSIPAAERSSRHSAFSGVIPYRWVPPALTPLTISLPRDNLANNSWHIMLDDDQDRRPEIEFSSLKFKYLKYRYIRKSLGLEQLLLSLTTQPELQGWIAGNRGYQHFYDNEINHICELYYKLGEARGSLYRLEEANELHSRLNEATLYFSALLASDYVV